MKLAGQEHLIPGDGLQQKWELMSSVGYDGIELHGHGDFQFRDRLPELRAARRSGVVMSSVCVIMDHFIGDFDESKRRDAIENMKSLLSVIAEVGGDGAVTPASYGMFSSRLPPYTPPRSPAEDRKVLIEGLRELGEHAQREGVLVYLEPLNRYEDHMINTLQQGIELCDAVGLESVKVMGDLYHMNIEEDVIPDSIEQAQGDVAHIHLADSNRAQPGAGHIDFKSAFAALKRINFSGWMALECGLRGDPSQVLTRVAQFLRKFM
jgi:sugar phosphate isomerase/epimerase